MSTVDPVTHPSPADTADWPLVLDGQLMRAGEAVIPAGDDGLIRGDGAFDAFPVVDGRPFARAAHLDRLERSCAALDLPCPREQIESYIDVLLARAGDGYTVIRVVLTRGGHRICRLEVRGDVSELTKPVRLLPVTYNPSVVLNGVKSLSYGANMQATRIAKGGGADEALLVRPDGIVLEAPTSTIFWADAGGQLHTPALDTGILDSITRSAVVEALHVDAGEFRVTEVLGASEVFLASTVREIQPVSAIDSTAFEPGPRAAEARDALRAAVAAELGAAAE